MLQIDEIFRFIEIQAGLDDDVNENSDIFNDLGCTGDDFHELINAYAMQFNVDMNLYLWYFHTDEEGQNIGGVFFRPPYQRVTRIPITPRMLLNFARTGKWLVEYPSHKLPKRRYDILINYALIVGLISFIIYSYL